MRWVDGSVRCDFLYVCVNVCVGGGGGGSGVRRWSRVR